MCALTTNKRKAGRQEVTIAEVFSNIEKSRNFIGSTVCVLGSVMARRRMANMIGMIGSEKRAIRIQRFRRLTFNLWSSGKGMIMTM